MADSAGLPTGAVPAPEAAHPRKRTRLGPKRAYQLGFFAALGIFTAYALVLMLGTIQGVLVTLAVSIFVALGLQPVIEWLTDRGLPRAVAAGLVTLALIAIAALGVWAIIPLVVDQVTAFAQSAPQLLDEFSRNEQVARFDRQFGVLEKIRAFVGSGTWVDALFGGFLGAGKVAATTLFSGVLTIVLVLYFTWTAPDLKKAIYQLAPGSKRPRVRFLANEVFQRIGDYLIAMLVVMALWGVGTFITLNVVGLGHYSLALTLLVMLLVIIPAVGSTIGGILCALVALSVSPGAALAVLLYFVIYQQLDAYLVQPKLFERSLKVPPVLVILGAICGSLLLGVVGALLAIPTVASLLLLYREVIVPQLDRA